MSTNVKTNGCHHPNSKLSVETTFHSHCVLVVAFSFFISCRCFVLSSLLHKNKKRRNETSVRDSTSQRLHKSTTNRSDYCANLLFFVVTAHGWKETSLTVALFSLALKIHFVTAPLECFEQQQVECVLMKSIQGICHCTKQ